MSAAAIGRMALQSSLAVIALFACGNSKPAKPASTGVLQLLATHALTITEPSGLAINESGTMLWTVTNNPDKVYQLDKDGTPVRTLNYVGEDLEGIAYDRSDKTLWIVEENRREIVHLDLNGDVLSRHALDLVGERNSGLEGICLGDKGRMFVLNEKQPGLFIEVNADFSIASRLPLDFAKDFSDLWFDRDTACFWILSDKSQKLCRWSQQKGVVSEYALPFPKAEGIACDDAANRLYIVSDSENKMYVYQIPPK